MKKTLSLFVLPSLAAVIVAWGLHIITGYSNVVNSDMLDHSGTNIVHVFMGLLFGFLPCLLYGLAIRWQENNAPDCQVSQVAPVLINKPIFEGLLISSPGCNCVLRVKKLNVSGILEFNNPDYQDYL